MRRIDLAVVIAAFTILPMRARAQPSIGGASIKPDGPGRYAIENALGQRKGTLVETARGVFQLRNEFGQLSDWKLKRRPDGGWDYVPSPFGDGKKSR